MRHRSRTRYGKPILSLAIVAAGVIGVAAVAMARPDDAASLAAAPTVIPPTLPNPATSPPAAITSLKVPSTTTPLQLPPKAVFTGRTTDHRATIAIAVLNGRAAAYFCDGRAVESWLTGTAVDGRVVLRSKQGDLVAAKLSGSKKLSGSVTIGGRRLTFITAGAEPPAGIYRASGPAGTTKTVIGWIVLPDGSQVGISARGNDRAPAPHLDPERPTAVIAGHLVESTPIVGTEAL